MAVNRRHICGHCYCRKTTQMIRYECDRCGVALGVNDPQRFIVSFEIFAAAGHIDLDADAAKEPRRGLEEIVQELAKADPDEIEDQTYRALRFDVCDACRRVLLASPLGRDRAK